MIGINSAQYPLVIAPYVLPGCRWVETQNFTSLPMIFLYRFHTERGNDKTLPCYVLFMQLVLHFPSNQEKPKRLDGILKLWLIP